MVRILVAEDEKTMNALVSGALRDRGYLVTSCFDGAEALVAFESGEFDLVLTDIMMPKLDGFALVESIRSLKRDVPVLLMTAKDDKQSQLRGYALGVDEYVVKPFDVEVLTLKVAAVLRRARIASERELTIGNLTMNAEEHTAYVDGKELALTVREFDLLFKFLSYPKKTFTRSALMEEFWDYDSSATSRTVDVYLAKLRDKTSVCDGFELVTVHGLGYKAVLK
ncbi:MAG: response regulator transcription factor [Christensenellaceae bacterium]